MLAKLLRLLGWGRDDRPVRPTNRVRPPHTELANTSTVPCSGTPGADTRAEVETRTIKGRCYVIDGDTIVIQKTHIRLAGIDAPELDQPWGYKAKYAMVRLCRGKTISAEVLPGLSYDRVVAKCMVSDGTDLAAELVKLGLALDWAKFSGGEYRHLEPDGVRKKLWRVDAKHRGKLPSAFRDNGIPAASG